MLRKVLTIFNKNDIKIISETFINIKKDQFLHPIKFTRNKIYSCNILKNYSLREIHKKIFFNVSKNPSAIRVEKAYLEWSNSKDTLDDLVDLKSQKIIICNYKTEYEFWDLKKRRDVLNPNQILIVTNNLPIRFFNNNISDLAFFYYTNQFNEDIVENYEKQLFRMG